MITRRKNASFQRSGIANWQCFYAARSQAVGSRKHNDHSTTHPYHATHTRFVLYTLTTLNGSTLPGSGIMALKFFT